MSSVELISELSVHDFQALVASLGHRRLVVRFTADWCRPCRRIEPLCHTRFASLPAECIIAELDIEETLDLYSAFTRAKMIRGVPAMLLFRGDVERDRWYIPDDSVSGDDERDVNAFFDRCTV
jgi:thioredoxin-like negative regulator of GroEL